ncbi:MAG TPA: UDP-N-acetylmuramoyl-L-alanine--D-glutamate ligase [bacterium]|nr:UDP-N-acetylmuramoyl-L-alanine--D-glutamate ligase [bacterium]HPW39825.1 UDP-N-acetylmuramoyl-L-alanine--D-glutamate ligase [bacterium]
MNWHNKRVTIMGLGSYRDGSGISATRFLLDQGAQLTVTDLKTADQLAPQIKRLGRRATKINFVLGRHRISDFKNTDLIIKNPGVPNTSKYLAIAVKNQIPIETDVSLFFQLIDRKRIIGITGTRGKSTTTTLIYEILKLINRWAVLGGNIAKSPLAQMSKVAKGGPVALELSSWMLESLAPHQISPYISVFTNIYPDHLNTYRGIDDYVAAKEHIFLGQNIQDWTILNRDNSFTRKSGAKTPGRRMWFSLKEFSEENGCFVRGKNIYCRLNGKEKRVLSLIDIKIPGDHNRANVLAAISGALAYGAPIAVIRKAVKNFKGVPNRLELLRTVKGVNYYNDTTSTTPEATMAALQSLGDAKQKKIILIAGGSDKGLDFNALAREIKKYCRQVIFLSGIGTDRLKQLVTPAAEVASMTEAVNLAQQFAASGEIILLSPACASFGLFNNEFDRGDQFRRAVKKL